MINLKPSRSERWFTELESGSAKFCSGGLFGSPPDPPDYSAVAASSVENAEIAREIAQDQLEWAKTQWGDQQELIGQIVDVQLPMMMLQAEAASRGMEAYNGFMNAQQQILWENHKNAMQDRSRYERMYQPIEDDLIMEAMSYDTPQRKALMAGRAQADVARAQEAARKATMMELEGYGIDPSAVRAQALDQSLRTQQAANQAAAGNAERQRVEDVGRAMRAAMVDVGRGYPSQIASAYGQAAQSGQAGLGGALAPQAGLANTAGGLGNLSGAWQGASGAMGSPAAWMGQSTSGIGTAGNIMNAGYGNQLQGWGLQQQYSPWNLAAGIGGMWAGSGFQGAPWGVPRADGGEVRGPGGPKDDLIPARLSDGEFVIPAEVVERKGTEFFDRLVDKTKKEVAATRYGADAPQLPQPTPAAHHPGNTQPWQLADGGMVPGYAEGGWADSTSAASASLPGTSGAGPNYGKWADTPYWAADRAKPQDWRQRQAQMGTYGEGREWFTPREYRRSRAAQAPQRTWTPEMVERFRQRNPGLNMLPGGMGQGRSLSDISAILASLRGMLGIEQPEGGMALPDVTATPGLWSGANPRPMFGYSSELAQQGQANENARLAWRNLVIQAMQDKIRTKPWREVQPDWVPTQLEPMTGWDAIRDAYGNPGGGWRDVDSGPPALPPPSSSEAGGSEYNQKAEEAVREQKAPIVEAYWRAKDRAARSGQPYTENDVWFAALEEVYPGFAAASAT